MNHFFTGAAILLVAALGAIQFAQPARTNPFTDSARTLERSVVVDPAVARTLDRACRDCHSHDTRWPWYSRVAPVSWFVVDHVNHGRRHLNFSEWPNDGSGRDKLTAICAEVTTGRMPMSSYTLLHRRARIGADEARQLCDWGRDRVVRHSE